MGFDLTIPPQLQRAAAREDLAVCNEATAKHGLRLTEPQMMELVERRGEALRATGRVEFGRGVVRELVRGFCDSPYLSQENYAEAIADVQDVFYRRKEDAEAAGEPIADDDLVEALRHAFDGEAAGSAELLADVPVPTLRTYAARGRTGEYDEKTQAETFEEEAAHDGAGERVRDEFSRVLDDERWERPGNEYADGFYDGYHALYRIGFDSNRRIGGSSLG